MTDELVDEVRTGTSQRVLIVLLALAVVGVAIWRLAPRGSRGEAEQAHRVLVVGGTPTDLTKPIAEAGFEADQQTWAVAEAHTRELEDRFDRDALLAYADEHGYGFLALIPGDDNPWPDASESAGAVVLGVGDLALDGQPRPNFGRLPEGLEFADPLRRAESLRVALYGHPDLLRLWDDPSPEQMQQQIHLAKLEDARTLLAAVLREYEDAVASVPARPGDVLDEPWVRHTGLPLAQGVLVERQGVRLVVAERRAIEVETRALAPMIVLPGASLNEAATVEGLPALHTGASSLDRRWLALVGDNDQLLRFEQRGDRLIAQAEVPVELGLFNDFAISNTGAIAHALNGRVAVPGGGFDLGPDLDVQALVWHGDELLALTIRRDYDRYADLLVLARPPATPEEPPALLGVPVELLVPAGSEDPTLVQLVPSAVGSFVTVDYATEDGASLTRLVRVDAPAQALRTPPPDAELGLLEAAIVTAEELGALRPAVDLGVLPPSTELSVTPDGRWAAWQADGSVGAIYVAPIEDDELGIPVRVARRSPGGHRFGETPMFTADSQALVFTQLQDWVHGGVEHLRVVSLPPAPALP